jgi:hypothetical protein
MVARRSTAPDLGSTGLIWGAVWLSYSVVKLHGDGGHEEGEAGDDGAGGWHVAARRPAL